MPYAIIGVLALLVALVFSRVKLPEITSEPDTKEQTQSDTSDISLWKHKNYIRCHRSIPLCRCTDGINSFFINYATENAGISAHEASIWLSFVGMGLFTVGRMGGSWIMSRILAEKVLIVCGLGASIAMISAIFTSGMLGVSSFFLCFLCESIMFPTIFALAIKGLGEQTKRASSFLIMSIVGGAIAPVLMGYIADTVSMSMAFFIPLGCFLFILGFGISYKKLIKA